MSTNDPAQLILDLGYQQGLNREDFLAAPCNAEAVAWLERWPHWPAHALALFGPAGSGKTHLLTAFAQGKQAIHVRALALDAAQVVPLVEQHHIVMIDDLETLEDETSLFHLWNLTRETGRFLVLAGREAPARLQVRLPDLHSRLAATPAVGIKPPDDVMLAALLVKHFADRQLKVSQEVVAYLLAHMERSFAGTQGVVEGLDRASLAQGRAVTVALARGVLEHTVKR